ncbi:MAG TPA: prolipoprotein diacylglyceryl transferase [Vicinamibacterales bacterium]|nr:prolipoprotein diacylglyceryl transferase [Vicinamibacterales bacterium]
MYPVLVRTPVLTIYTFGVLLAAAYLAALGWVVRAARRAGFDPDVFMSLGMTAIIGALAGAKALYLIRNPSDFWSWSFVSSAGDFYGGFVGALVASAIFFWRHPTVPIWRASDICAPAIALGQAIGRLGCFMAGDDYGRPATIPWAVTFTAPDAARIGGAPLGVPLHPVQLYEAAFCLALFGFLAWFARRRHRDGDVIAAYTLLYAIGRFVIEFFRGDADRGFVFGGLFSISQFIAIIMFAIASAVLIVRHGAGARR